MTAAVTRVALLAPMQQELAPLPQKLAVRGDVL